MTFNQQSQQEFVTVGVGNNTAFRGIYSVHYSEQEARDNLPRVEAYYREREPERLPVQVMTFDEFFALQKSALSARPADRIDSEKFREMLEVLPPKHWYIGKHSKQFCMSVHFERFCMIEHFYNSWTSQYVQKGYRFMCKLVDVTDKATWVTQNNFDELYAAAPLSFWPCQARPLNLLKIQPRSSILRFC
ncbi:hypothetical protein [Kushneria indalinina]|uniref:Uncharacterized protein n=1 Tax=Kushneria indalinina DSM 14324 TaxID=1122140 RepID=A0A3D9DRK3_9GAMM|nr:hypothetical protein [Kushneria indalinina]REC93378.1 hypothetical protein C8D72_3422 [Kushneria indalinina DSM 14324]